jgi:hypothetical protein
MGVHGCKPNSQHVSLMARLRYPNADTTVTLARLEKRYGASSYGILDIACFDVHIELRA